MKWSVVRFILLSIALVALTGCNSVPPAEQLMPSVKYTGAVGLSKPNPKTAYVTWHTGKVVGAEIPVTTTATDPLSAAIAGVIVANEHQNHRNAFVMKYGTAQQAVFMTSLRDAMSERDLFKQVKLVSDKPQKQTKNDVFIDVYFKKTQVEEAMGDIPVNLDVVLSIKPPHRARITKVIHTSSDKSLWDKWVWGRSFVESQSNVSEKLMNKVMDSLEDYAKV